MDGLKCLRENSAVPTGLGLIYHFTQDCAIGYVLG
jgi:hypothetical protein